MKQQSIVLLWIMFVCIATLVSAVKKFTICRTHEIQSNGLRRYEGQGFFVEEEKQCPPVQIDEDKVKAIVGDEIKAMTEQPVSNYSNCDDIYEAGFTFDGSYNIAVNGTMLGVYCEFQRNGNNWMVFQKRFSGEVDFFRNWNDYVEGFGQKYGEFWFGLKSLHEILSTGHHMLRVDIEDWDGNTAYAEYRTFSIGNESTNYRSTILGYSGNAGDGLARHNNQQFSTKDRDNDGLPSYDCSNKYFGAWWYWECADTNLNGKYLRDGTISDTGITWNTWKTTYSMKKSEMKIRPVQQ